MKKKTIKYVVGGIIISLAAGAVVGTGALLVRNELVRILNTKPEAEKERIIEMRKPDGDVTEYLTHNYGSYEVSYETPISKNEGNSIHY